MMLHLLCCQGFAVGYYSFTLDALDLQHPRLLQHQGKSGPISSFPARHLLKRAQNCLHQILLNPPYTPLCKGGKGRHGDWWKAFKVPLS